MTSDLEKSFKAKIRSIAKEKNRDPADLWQNLTLERFLVRLAHSQYRNYFIFKGGLLLSKYIEINRETKDLDFLARNLSNELKGLRDIFHEITCIDMKDGFTFQESKVYELAHPHMAYSGATATMTGYFGRTRFKVDIDIGFGDIVSPVDYALPLMASSKGTLFESSISLSCYPKEFIFAEKLETIIYRGSFNSRMKDFHDLYSMISVLEPSHFNNLAEIIRSVFEHRGTILAFPISYGEDEISQMQIFWTAYLKNLRTKDPNNLPANFAAVVVEINNWLTSNIYLN